MNWHDIAERLVWTFVQSAAGSWLSFATANAAGWIELTTSRQVVGAAIAAGTAAVLSALKTIAQERLARFPDTRATP